MVSAIALVGCLSGVIAPDHKVAQDIASRLDVQPSWTAIQEYLDQAFVPGLTRDQVHEVLDKVGPYEVIHFDPDNGSWDPASGQLLYGETINFTERNTSWALRGWHFDYDKDGKLVKAHQVDYP